MNLRYKRSAVTDPDLIAARRKLAGDLRDTLIRLGPTFIKVGQLLSTRVDVLPAEVVNELSQLQNNVRAWLPCTLRTLAPYAPWHPTHPGTLRTRAPWHPGTLAPWHPKGSKPHPGPLAPPHTSRCPASRPSELAPSSRRSSASR